MHTTPIRDVLTKGPTEKVEVGGWVRSLRNSKNFSFLVLNDGSTQQNLQIVLTPELANYQDLITLNIGSCIHATGALVSSQGKGQTLEMQAQQVEIMGRTSEEYPLQKKSTSLEFLREVTHLRARTNTFGAVFRVRHALSFAIHEFFHRRHFFYVQTPITTSADCEGAGEMFRLTTPPNQDFYGRPAYLTVSGQLNAEALALGLGQVYTFGPTFRAENSHTSRHLSEFWMVEPEAAFYDLPRNIQLAQDLIQHLLRFILKECPQELAFLSEHYQKDLLQTLEQVAHAQFVHLTYTEAVEILCSESVQKKAKFQYPVSWGIDLQSEHERYLTDIHFKSPVTVTDYPKAIKAFYMKQNADGKTVRAMDLLVPGIGELVGGSQREDDESILRQRIQDMKLPVEEYEWYLQLRRFGGVVHSGFGMGFERMVMYATGMSNIRDVIPFPRYAGHIQF